MTQPIVQRPLQEVDRDYDSRFEPTASFHLLGRDSRSPAAFRCVGQN
jgi:hypothetical protein